MHKNQILVFLALIPFIVNLGCSVGMAMSGKNNPNLGMIRKGASRDEVELTLGPPIKTVSIDAGRRLDVYSYQIGNEASAGRATGHAVMDLLTLGLWEIVGTPIEANQGDEYELSITYDKDDRVESINQAAKISPTPQTAKKESCDSTIESCI